MVAGCGPGTGRSPVRGNVNFEGQPVEQGGIVFLPEGSGENDQPRATGEIHNGHYDLDDHHGPRPGPYRVQITWQKKTGRQVPRGEEGRLIDEMEQVIPPRYNTESELIVEVKPGRNTFNFDQLKN
jgi:hypothetical protein